MLPLVLAIIGAASGVVSLAVLLVTVGVYKQKVDRHERWFNLLVDDSIMLAWRNGSVDRGSIKPTQWLKERIPEDVELQCRMVAYSLKNGRVSHSVIADKLLRALGTRLQNLAEESSTWVYDGLCEHPSGRFGLTSREILGALIALTIEIAQTKPIQNKGGNPWPKS